MRVTFLIATMMSGAAGLNPAYAQDAQDQIDPTQLEERDEEPPRDDVVPIYIEPEPLFAVPGQQRQYDIGAILITGNSALPDEAFLDIIETYGARTLSDVEIASLVDAIARRARERGYVLAMATIEPQSLAAGVLRVSLEEGTIDEIRISGVDEAAISRQLRPLVGGGPVTLRELERGVLIAGDVAGVYIRSTRFEREGDRNVLFVEARRDTVAASVEIENDGSEPVGPLRARIDADFNGILTATDEVDLTWSTSIFEPSELQYLRASYAAVAGSNGLELGVTGSYSVTEPGGFLQSREILGRSWRAELRASYPLLRSRRASLWLEGEFEARDLRQDRRGIEVQRDRLAVLRAGAYGLADVGGGRLRGRFTLARGLDILGATQAGDPLASRSDASGQFTLAEAWVHWERGLSGDLSLALAARGQLASDPLLITEDLGLGGPQFLRAYSYNERSGDEGIMGSGELRYDWDDPLRLARRLQFYGYFDGGIVNDIGDTRNDGSLFSTGAGVRVDITRNLDFDLELAVPLSGPRFDSDESSPKLNFKLSQNF